MKLTNYLPQFLIILLIQLQLIQNELIELNDETYKKFPINNSGVLVGLCNTPQECKHVSRLLSEVSSKAFSELGREMMTGFLDCKKYPNTAKNNEGTILITYMHPKRNEYEIYIGKHYSGTILKFLRSILLLDIKVKNVKSENELIQTANGDLIQQTEDESNITENCSVVFIGNLKYSGITIESLMKATQLADLRNIYMVDNPEYVKQLGVEDYDIALVKLVPGENPHIRRLGITDNEDNQENHTPSLALTTDQLKNLFLINKNNLKGYFKPLTTRMLDSTLSRSMPTLIYVYGNKKDHLNEELEASFKALAQVFSNELLFTKALYTNKSLKMINFNKFFNLTKEDLPAAVILAPNPYNSIDMEKYIITGKQAFEVRKQKYEDLEEKNYTLNKTDLIEKNAIISFVTQYKEGKVQRIPFSENDDLRIMMMGENFETVIDNALEENKEVILMLCPPFLKKYGRLRKRMEKAYARVHEANDKFYLFDEIDPFSNEVTGFNINYYPTIAYIKSNPNKQDKQKWIVSTMDEGFKTSDIIDFIKNNSSKEDLKVQLNDDSEEIDKRESKRPLYPIYRKRIEDYYLSHNIVEYYIGFKRLWLNMKQNGLVKTSGFVDYNEYEENENENFVLNDEINEDEPLRKDEL